MRHHHLASSGTGRLWPLVATLACLGGAARGLEPNLAALEEAMPGAGGASVWTADSGPTALPALAAAGGKLVALPADATAVGAAWPVPHVADAVSLLFSAPPPPGSRFGLEVFSGGRWIPHPDGATVRTDGDRLELSFEPVATTMLRVFVPPGLGVGNLVVRRFLADDDPKKPTWPARLIDGSLDRALLARDEEPSFEALALHTLSMPTWAMMGLKDTGHEQAVYWDGRIHANGRRVFLSLGEPGVRLAAVRDTIRRRLLDGWLPAVIVEAQVGPVAVRQTAFMAYAGPGETRPATWVRVELTNVGDRPYAGPLNVELEDAPPDPFDWALGVEIFTPPRDKSRSEWTHAEGLLLRNGRPFLAAAGPCRPGSKPGVVTFDVELEPRGRAVFDLALPSLPWEASAEETRALAQMPWEGGLEAFRAYWDRLMEPATRLDLPEPRLVNLHRGVLAQLFINGYGDIMAYGADPSNYDGSVYGGEEGFAILSLAMNGFGPDAGRYLSGTYLRPAFMAKAEKFERGEDRNQQNKNGLTPHYAVEVFRLTRDRDWIAPHVDMLRACAEWTIAERRKTMLPVDGQRPPHYGLLPQWAHGGDLHDLCHPLTANWFCWRGLADTAWLLGELGDAETSARYRREADEYRETILTVMNAIYRQDATPPFLPLTVEDAEPPKGDFYQLFADWFMALMPLPPDDPRSRWIPDFLRADNRSFCMVARFRSDGDPRRSREVGAGGLDGIYSSGHLLHHLRHGHVREFLLGFYGYQAFNMERDCYTSREANRLYAADAHLGSYFVLADWSDPLPCGSAVGLLLLRHLLVTEEILGTAAYTGRLHLLPGAPRRWYEAGKRIAVTGAVTHAGVVSFTVTPAADGSRIEAVVDLPAETTCPAVSIRLPHPDGRPLRAATIDGRATESFDPQAATVEVAEPRGRLRIVAEY